MNKFLKTLSLFILYAILVYLVLITIWGGFVPQTLRKNILAPQGLYFTYERLQDAKNHTEVDILFLGSSRSYRGFDPRIFDATGYSSFNLGTSSQTPIQSELLLKKYLNELNPRLVIFEVTPDAFSMDGIESAMEIIANIENDCQTTKMMFDYNDIRLYNTWLYKNFWDFTRRNHIPWGVNTYQKKLYARLKGEDTYIEGGYVEKELLYFEHAKYEKKDSWHYNDKQFAAFDNCIKLIETNQSEVLLIQSPYTKSLYDNYTNNGYFDSCMNVYGNYYNFNELMHLDDSLYFYDATHMNQNGVELFDEKVIELLKNNYNLNDKLK